MLFRSVSAWGGSGASFTAVSTQNYGGSSAFTIGSTAVSGALTVYITNSSGSTSTSTYFRFLSLLGAESLTYSY